MKNLVKFTYSIHNYVFDISNDLESEFQDEKNNAKEIIALIQQLNDRKSKADELSLKSKIFKLNNICFDLEIANDKIFSDKNLQIEVSEENSDLDFSIDADGLGYRLDGDIFFEMKPKKIVSEEMIESWIDSTGGFDLPAISCNIGEYSCDSGSQFSWEIIRDEISDKSDLKN